MTLKSLKLPVSSKLVLEKHGQALITISVLERLLLLVSFVRELVEEIHRQCETFEKEANSLI